MLSISLYEKKFILDGVQADIRTDGRKRADYRPILLQIGVVDSASGSALLRIGGTTILCGVKLEIGHPNSQTPDQGLIKCHIECCPSASPQFEGKRGEEETISLTKLLERTLCASTNALSHLSIVKGEQCWILYVDCQVLESDGSLIDALTLCSRAALFDTKLPTVKISTNSSGETDLEIDADPHNFVRFDVESIPICVSLTQLGRYWIVDCTIEEELCLNSRLTIGVDSNGSICGIEKTGPGGFDPSILPVNLKLMKWLGQKLLSIQTDLFQKHIKTGKSELAAGLFTLGS